MDCNCYPKLSYFFYDWGFTNNPDSHFLSQFNTYGTLLGIGSLVFIWLSASYLKWDFLHFIKLVFIPFCIAFCGNILFNVAFGHPLLSLSTTPFLCSYLLFASLCRIPKSLFLILLIAVGITKLGCHFSGDGDWGTSVAKDSLFYDTWKDCRYARNIVNEGETIKTRFLNYNKTLTSPKYPLPLMDAIVFALIAFLSFFSKRINLEISGSAFCVYSIFSNSLSQTPFNSVILLFYGITFLVLFIMIWNTYKERKQRKNQLL